MATPNLFTALFRRTAPSVPTNVPKFPYHIKNNPYQCKRRWPPDFDTLSSKHKFRLERRYRRRTKLKWARPGWNKAVQLVQWGSILFVVAYGVIWLDVDGDKYGSKRTVFDGMRGWWMGGSVGEVRGAREGGYEGGGGGGDGEKSSDATAATQKG